MKKKLPKAVYVYWKEYEKDVPSLVAAEKPEDCLEGEIGSVFVGKYVLFEQSEVAAIPTVIPMKVSKR